MADSSAGTGTSTGTKRRRPRSRRGYTWISADGKPVNRDSKTPTRTNHVGLDYDGSHFFVGGHAAVSIARGSKKVRCFGVQAA